MKIHVTMWDRENRRYRQETITDEDLRILTQQKIKEWTNVSEQNLQDFKIDNVEI